MSVVLKLIEEGKLDELFEFHKSNYSHYRLLPDMNKYTFIYRSIFSNKIGDQEFDFGNRFLFKSLGILSSFLFYIPAGILIGRLFGWLTGACFAGGYAIGISLISSSSLGGGYIVTDTKLGLSKIYIIAGIIVGAIHYYYPINTFILRGLLGFGLGQLMSILSTHETLTVMDKASKRDLASLMTLLGYGFFDVNNISH